METTKKNLFTVTGLIYITIFIIPLVYFDNKISTEYFWIKSLWLNILAYGGLTYWLYLSLKKGEFKFYLGLTTIPIILFSLLAASSLLWSINYYKGAELILKVGGGIGVYLLIINNFNSKKNIMTFIGTAQLATFFVILYGILQYSQVLYLPKDQYGESDPSSTIGLTNFVLEYVIVLLPAYFTLMPALKSRISKILVFSSMLPLYYYFIIAKNRASLVAFVGAVFFAIIVVLFYRYKKKMKFPFSLNKTLIVIATLIIIGVGLLYGTKVGKDIRKKFESITQFREYSIRFRLETWSQAPKMVKDKPFGRGLANLEIIFPKYYTPYLITMTLHNNTRVVRSHNEYVQTLVDLGLEGFLLLLWIIVAIFVIFWRIMSLINNWDDFWLFLTIATGIVGFLIMAFFTFPLQEPTSSLFFWSSLGLLEVLYKIFGKRDNKSITINNKAIISGLLLFSIIFTLFTTILTFKGTKGEILYKEARLLKSVKRWNYSKKLLDQAIASNPTMEGFYYDRAVSLMKMNNMEAAMKDLEQTAKMVPNYGIGRQQLGYMYYQQRNYKKALEHLLAAYQIYFSHPFKYAKYILHSYIALGKKQKAVDFANEVYHTVESNKKFKKNSKRVLTLYLALADTYSIGGKFDKAVKLFKEIIDNNPTNTEALMNISITLKKMKKYKESANFCKRLIDVNSSNGKAWYTLGEDYYYMNELEQSVEAFKQSFRLDPSLKKLAGRNLIFNTNKELLKLLNKSTGK